MEALRAGKLDTKLLSELLHGLEGAGARLAVPPRVGEDAAAIELPDRYLVVATDPITFVTEELGYYVVTINANDVATMGARPLFLTCVLLFPEGATTEEEVRRAFTDIRSACQEQGIALAGGHTEVTQAVRQPVIVGQMLGEVSRDKLVRKDGMRPGDTLLLTKGLAIEAVSIIAQTRPGEVERAYGRELLERARGFLRAPGISVVQEALAACRAGQVRAMHDPTEGGLASALHELASASSCGLVVDRGAIPIYPEARALCEHYGLDPLGVIASGSLLLAVAPDSKRSVIETIQRNGVACTAIGRVTAASGCRFADGSAVPTFPADEITKLF